jgi:transcriptional regulator with XRE-family HTH domain
MDVEALIGWNVARLRSRLGMSQHELAQQCGIINQSYVSGLERGHRNPTAVMLAHLATSLGVQAGELFSTNGAPREILEGPILVRSSRSKKRTA